MERFENATLGDKVYSRIHGHGVIQSFNKSGNVLDVFFPDNICNERYWTDGKYNQYNPEPILFYVDGANNYLTERPAPKLDWNKVPVDTRVLVSNDSNNIFTRRRFAFFNTKNSFFNCWGDGSDSWACDGNIQNTLGWTFIKLAEEVTIDGITFPIGSK